MARKATKKALARGRVKKRKMKLPEPTAPAEMVIGEKTYTVGDMAWFVDESSGISKRPKQGELTAVYPNDSTEPAVGLVEALSGKHRAIRARLIGWSKKEANENWDEFLEEQEQK